MTALRIGGHLLALDDRWITNADDSEIDEDLERRDGWAKEFGRDP